jgi:N-carbamoyl-L-amino-acid hydrolase
LASFAGHDAVFMAHLGPVGMLFVPSRDGRSHCPEEWTDGDEIAIGVHTLAQALVHADREGLPTG